MPFIIIVIVLFVYKESALHKAIKEGHAAVVESLLDDGADFHAIDKVNYHFNTRVESASKYSQCTFNVCM